MRNGCTFPRIQHIAILGVLSFAIALLTGSLRLSAPATTGAHVVLPA